MRRNGPAVRPAEPAGRTAGRWFGRTAGRVGSGGPAGRSAARRSGRPNRPADTAAEPNRRNLTGRAGPPPRVPPVHSVQPGGTRIHVYRPERVLRSCGGLAFPQQTRVWGQPRPAMGVPQLTGSTRITILKKQMTPGWSTPPPPSRA